MHEYELLTMGSGHTLSTTLCIFYTPFSMMPVTPCLSSVFGLSCIINGRLSAVFSYQAPVDF